MPDDSRRSTVVDDTKVPFPRPAPEAAPFLPEGRLLSQEELRAIGCTVWLPSRVADRLGGKADRRPGAGMGSVLDGYLRSVLGEEGMSPADAGMELESASGGTAPHGASGDWGLRIALITVLFLMALCTAFALNSYVSERMMTATHRQGLDNAAERFRVALTVPRGGDPQWPAELWLEAFERGYRTKLSRPLTTGPSFADAANGWIVVQDHIQQ